MRRSFLRATGLFAVALAAITCTDAGTGPGGPRATSPARLVMAPSFSPAAARAFALLTNAGIAVSQVHIVLTTPDGMVAKDTVIAFPADKDTLHIDLSLHIQGTEQSFNAQMDLLDATGTILFSHTQTVVARASGLPAAPPPTIVLEYVGPGHAARALTVSPSGLTLPLGVPQPLVATATDSAGRVLADLIVSWASSDTTIATVASTGRATANVTGTGRRGAVTITATTPTGVTGTARLTLQPRPTSLVVVSGNGQTGAAGHALTQPVVIEVRGPDNDPIANAAVVVTPVSGGGVVGSRPADTLLTTDSTGHAAALLTLGRTGGTYTFQARAGLLVSPVITAVATPAPPVAIALVSGDAQSDVASKALAQPFAVKVSDEFGAVVAGATVAWTHAAGTGSLAAATSVTDSLGVARVRYTLGTVAGVDSVRAVLPGLTSAAASATFTARTVAGAAARLTWLQAPPDTLVVGAQIPLVSARLADVFGNVVRRAGVKIQVRGRTPVPGDSLADSTATDTAGIARVTLPSYAGVVGRLTLSLSSVGLDSVVKPILAVAGAPARLVVASGLPTSAASGVAFAQPIVVQVVDAGRNPVPASVAVTIGVVGSATLGGPATVTTAPDGRATFSGLSMSGVAGSYALQFSAAGLANVVTPAITLTGGVPAALNIVAGNAQVSTVASLLAVRPTVRVDDANGNVVRAGRVIFSARTGGSVAPDTASVGPDGTASTGWTLGTLAGADTLIARVDGTTLTALFTARGVAGTGAALGFLGGWTPGSVGSGAILAPQPVVQLLDANGNRVTTAGVVVVARVAAGSGSLLNAAATTDSTGKAVFSGLSIAAAVGSVTLAFDANGYTPVTSSSIDVTAGAPGALVLETAPPAIVTNGRSFTTSPVVRLQDAAGNAVTAPGIVVTVAVTGSATLVGQATATTTALGRATFGALSLTGLIGDYTLTFSAATLNPVTAIVHLAAGAPAVLDTVPGYTRLGVQGGLAPARPAVVVKDASGNLVDGVDVLFTAVSPGDSVSAGTMARTATVRTTAGGLARVTDWKFGATGYDTLTATLGSLAATFTATTPLGAATHFVVVSGGAQSTIVTQGLTSPVVLEARDANNRPVPNVKLFAEVADNRQGTVRYVACLDCIQPANATTDSAGRAAFFWNVSRMAKADTVQVRGETISPMIVTATAMPGPAAQLVVLQHPDTYPASASGPVGRIQVAFSDVGGVDTLDIAGPISLDFSSAPPGSTIGGRDTVVAVHGIATFTDIRLNKCCTYALIGKAGTLQSALFNLNEGPLNIPTHFAVLGTAPRRGTVTDTLPDLVVVQARDVNEDFVPNVPMRVRHNAAGDQGFVRVTGVNYLCDCSYVDSTRTDGFGNASFAWTLSRHAKVDSVTVGNSGIPPLLVTATADPGPASALRFVAPSGLSDDAGNTLRPFQVVVTDKGGYDTVAANVNISLTLLGCDGPCPVPLGTLSKVAANGIAIFDSVRIMNALPRPYRFMASDSANNAVITGFSDGFNISVVGPHFVVVGTLPSSAAAGSTLTVQLRSQTAHGEVLPNTPIVVETGNQQASFHLAGGVYGGARDSSTTDANGLITLTWTMPTSANNPNQSATVHNSNTATGQELYLSVYVVAAQPAKVVVVLGPSDGTVGIPLSQVRTQLADQYDNLIYGVPGTVTASLVANPSGASLSGTLTLPITGGLAVFTDLSVSARGQGYSLHFATPDGLLGDSRPFNIAGPASSIAATVWTTTSGTVGLVVPEAVTAQVLDAGGAPVRGVTVNFATLAPGGVLSPASVITDLYGVASAQWQLGTVAGNQTATATVAGVQSPATFNIVAAPGSIATLTLPAQGTLAINSGVVISPAITGQVADAFANPAGGTVTIAVVPGGSGTGTLSGTLTVSAASGVAAFNDLRFSAPGTYKLQVSSGAVTSAIQTYTVQ